jgi:peptidyl-prolyl cis-trans isomerase C
MTRKLSSILVLLAMLVLAAVACNDPKPAPVVQPPDQKADAGTMPAADAGTTPAADAGTKAEAKPAATGPVAVVNGVEISREKYNQSVDELKKRFSMFGGNIPEAQLARFQQKIIERMVEDELLGQEMKKNNVAASEEDINKEFEAYKAKTPGGAEQFDQFLARSGMTPDKIKEDIRQRLTLKQYLNKDGALNITDEEIAAYYKENEKRYEVKERIKASHILVKVDPKDDKAKQDEAKKKIDGLYAEVSKKGSDFNAIAKEKSDGPSAPRGGDLGFFSRGRMVKEFEDVAFAMKPGTLSKPVKTQFGWHIIKLEEKQDAGTRKLEEVKDEIKERLESRKFRTERDKLLERLRKDGKVEVLEKIEIPATPPGAPGSAPGGLQVITPGGAPADGAAPGGDGAAPGGAIPIKIDPKNLPIKLNPNPGGAPPADGAAPGGAPAGNGAPAPK